jgi:hypothetical protein
LSELGALVEEYRAGLEAEMALLHRLEALAVRQQAASKSGEYHALREVSDEREGVMASLVTVEHGLKPIRLALVEARDVLADVLEFQEVADLHRTAAHLVSAIITADQESLSALKEAEVARRFAARTIEQGESTLAAYRRVVAPPLTHATIMNRRG